MKVLASKGSRKLVFLIGSLAVGFLALYGFSSFAVGVAFALIWLDKVILGVFEPIRHVGVELTTAASVILGISLGPVNAFIVCIIMLPILHAVKHIALPLTEPDWPLFVPSPYDFVSAAGAAVAGMVAGWPLFWIIFAAVLVKVALYAVADTQMLGMPVHYFAGVTTFLFNVTAGYFILLYFAGIAGISAG